MTRSIAAALGASALLAPALWSGAALAGQQREQQPGAWAPEHQALANTLGTVAVAGQMAAETLASWRAADRRRALACEGLRLGIAFGMSEALKHTVREWRPNGHDPYSFPSLHTAFAVSASGWRWAFGVPVSAFVGETRIWANWHRPRDVWAGAAIGALDLLATRRACRADR